MAGGSACSAGDAISQPPTGWAPGRSRRRSRRSSRVTSGSSCACPSGEQGRVGLLWGGQRSLGASAASKTGVRPRRLHPLPGQAADGLARRSAACQPRAVTLRVASGGRTARFGSAELSRSRSPLGRKCFSSECAASGRRPSPRPPCARPSRKPSATRCSPRWRTRRTWTSPSGRLAVGAGRDRARLRRPSGVSRRIRRPRSGGARPSPVGALDRPGDDVLEPAEDGPALPRRLVGAEAVVGSTSAPHQVQVSASVGSAAHGPAEDSRARGRRDRAGAARAVAAGARPRPPRPDAGAGALRPLAGEPAARRRTGSCTRRRRRWPTPASG